jgi:hippurate hydrolase
VIAARTVLALQTIVSRENDPRDPTVVTVGSIHGGTKENVIPDSVRLALTVRWYKEGVRRKLLAAIERIAKAEALAANAPKPPAIEVTAGLKATVNDPALTARLVTALRRTLGEKNVVEIPPKMVSEDFSEYGLAGIPAAQFHVGAVEPQHFAEAMKSGETLPSLHSALFAPDREPTIKTAILTETTAVLELMGK